MLEIVQMFAERGYQLTPEALEILSKRDTGSIDHLISNLDASTVVVSAEQILLLLDGACGGAAEKSAEESAKDASATTCAPEHSSSGLDVEVLKEITGRSTCLGNYSDFVKYFRDRYAKIHDLLSKRMSSRPIESVGTQTAGREVSVIGMIMDIRNTSRARVVELEDPTGMVTVLFARESPAYEDSMLLVTDEVVGIIGTSDGKGRIFAKSIVWPDLQAQPQPLTSASGGALFLSDLHVGSKKFLIDTWNRFVYWISGEDPTGLSSGVGCIVIAGDIVDGIGVYPGQEDELEIKDIYEQYQLAADLISEIPSRIKIVISPGNHDIVREAEPQPALPKEIQSLFTSNVIFVGNPSWITISSRPVLIYHGRSIDDFVLKVPGLSYREPELAMVEMLRRRHLCPIYGNRVSVAPEIEDHYVIDKPPAILHCGHVHVVGITRYKGVTVINSGTWQGQTEFQKKMNIQPTPGIVPHVDLSTMKVRKLRFT